jgi:hypothetical protein
MEDSYRFMSPEGKTPYDLLQYLYVEDQKELVKLVLDMLARANYQDGLLATIEPAKKEISNE